MSISHSLADLMLCHREASQFFASELMLLKDVVPKIVDDRLAKAALLLISAGQTGAALLQLASQTDTFTGESMMLARSFMEKMTNFCYVGICDETEFRAFVLHPVYKYYHRAGSPTIEEDLDFLEANTIARTKKQEDLRQIPVVKEALSIFSETKDHMNWTKKTLGQRIDALENWGKLMDVFFTLNKIQYYSDASEALHGSLYGCTFKTGILDPAFDRTAEQALEKKLFKESAYVLLHLGMLVHEAMTLISYSNEVTEIWEYSYKNRNNALSLLYHIIGKISMP